MKTVTIDGVEYEAVKATYACQGCVALPEVKRWLAGEGDIASRPMCLRLGDQGIGCLGIIWKEVKK